MNRLRVLPPDTITRVSAYVPEIVKFVEKIIENGFAYVTASTGDVWFDVAAFEGAKGKGKGKEKEDHAWEHVYAKLAPWSKGNRRLLEEGEGGHFSLVRWARTLVANHLSSLRLTDHHGGQALAC
jgi:cysteinyl-tRNA synthetase